MRVRATILASILAMVILSLAACGGGGGGAAIGTVPEGKYFSLNGSNPAQKFNSPMYKKYMDEVDKAEDWFDDAEDEAKDLGIDLNRYTSRIAFSSEKVEENLNYIGGPSNPDDMEDFFEDKLNWDDIDEEEENGRKYYVGEVAGQKKAYIVAAGGVFYGSEDVIEDVLKVLTKGDDKLVGDKDYQAATPLVDFNATEYSLIWDNMDGQLAGFQNLLRQVTDDEDVIDLLKDIEALGMSSYWGGDLRFVFKIRFEDDKAATEFMEFLEDEMDEIFEKLGPTMVKGFLAGEDTQDEDDAEDLAKNVKLHRAGNVVEINFTVKWEEMEVFLD